MNDTGPEVVNLGHEVADFLGYEMNPPGFRRQVDFFLDGFHGIPPPDGWVSTPTV